VVIVGVGSVVVIHVCSIVVVIVGVSSVVVVVIGVGAIVIVVIVGVGSIVALIVVCVSAVVVIVVGIGSVVVVGAIVVVAAVVPSIVVAVAVVIVSSISIVAIVAIVSVVPSVVVSIVSSIAVIIVSSSVTTRAAELRRSQTDFSLSGAAHLGFGIETLGRFRTEPLSSGADSLGVWTIASRDVVAATTAETHAKPTSGLVSIACSKLQKKQYVNSNRYVAHNWID